MPHEFEVRKEIEFQATPEEVWEAIATGTGIDGWYLGTGNAVEPGLGGKVRISFGSEDHEGGSSTITTWEPPTRFAYRGDPHPDGTFHAIEYVVEGRAGGTTVVRLVHSGMLGDDWEIGVRRAQRRRLHVPPPDDAVRHPLPRPAGEARDGLAAGHRSGPGDGDAAHRDGCLGRPERG